MKNLHYSDIVLKHGKGIVSSRSECDTSISFGNKMFKIPVIPANMTCTIDFNLADWMSRNGYFYILHRFYDYEKILNWIAEKSHSIERSFNTVSISVGVKEWDYRFVERIVEESLKVDFLTVDVAFAYAEHVIKFVDFVKNKSGYKGKLIVGNVGTVDAVKFFDQEFEVDAIKVGLSYGAACSTYSKTGFATPMFSTIREIVDTYEPNCKIIADGGIKNNGDITKALVAGADMVMAGSIFAGCYDSPAENIVSEGYDSAVWTKEKYLYIEEKYYYGSASEFNKGHKNHIEGTKIKIPVNGMEYSEKLFEIEQDLQSAISYAGGKDLKAFWNVEWTCR
jgi:GMP reductase